MQLRLIGCIIRLQPSHFLIVVCNRFELVVQLLKRITFLHVLGSNLPNPGAGAEGIAKNVDFGAIRVRGWWRRLLALET